MKSNLMTALAGATCALLATPDALAEDPHDIGVWDISGGILVYNESGRVQAVEPIINGQKALDTDEYINIKLTLDSLTGASANGAVPSTQAQTFTRPSGRGLYITPAESIPLDDTFRDTRATLSTTWSRPSVWDTQAEWGVNLSREFDYRSIAGSTTFAKDFNNNNTTFSSGLSLSVDRNVPVGGVPVPFATMQAAGEPTFRLRSAEHKKLVDVITGVTQIIDQFSLFQFNYSISAADGYLNDPYKVVSVVDATTGAPVFNNDLEANLPFVVYENRPGSRTKHTFYGQYKRFINEGDVLDTSYRFLTDDWGIDSHTIDIKYRKALSDRRFIQPHIRFYQQSAADFYRPFFVSGDEPQSADTTRFASADYRLGNFNAYTVGLEFGQVNKSNSWSVALEYYLQSGKEPEESFGELRNLALSTKH